MDWIKSHYEQVSLSAAATILVASAGFVFLLISGFSEQIGSSASGKSPDNSLPTSDVAALEAAKNAVLQPRPWAAAESSLLVSRPYILRGDDLVDPLEGDKELHPPITNAWLTKYALDYADGQIGSRDPDGDRFSNLEEFMGNTDPTDAKSIPPYRTKLRLKKYAPVPFNLKFSGTPDDGVTFTINSKDLKSRTQFLKIGDSIEGAPYKILGYQKKSVMDRGIEKNASELTIQNTETGKQLVLVFGRDMDDPTSFGEFLYLFDNSEIKVKKDDEFTLPQDSAKKYKLVDINESEAVIQDVATGDKFPVQKAP